MEKYFGDVLIAGYLSFSLANFSRLDVYKYIGTSQTQLINSPGNPSPLDNTNSTMAMIFYRSSFLTKSFVADKNGIYQAEETQTFDTEKNCKTSLNIYLSDLSNKGFVVDSLSESEFNSSKSSVSCNINYGLNELTKKYVICFSPQEGVLKS